MSRKFKGKWVEKTCGFCSAVFSARLCYVERGQMKFCSPLCGQKAARKSAAQFFDGTRYAISVQGYFCATDGSARKIHRVIWEHHNGPIPQGHVIHHIDHDKANNDISNLQLMEWGEHISHHNRGKDRSKPKATCIIDGCQSNSRARKKCTKHYQQEMAKERGQWL